MSLTYNQFNEILLELRNEFHKNGRLDDSNAKLDEIIKLLFMGIFEAKKNSNRLNLEYLRGFAEQQFGDRVFVAKALRFLFEEIVQEDQFKNTDGTNIFGSNTSLNIQETENQFAEKVVTEISKIDFKSMIKHNSIAEFDLINECFGHFVRDNFRNNKEDAQYMTPQEIVEPVLKMVFYDIINEDFNKRVIDQEEEFIIMDPTCGVGTLIIESLRYLLNYINGLNLEQEKKENIRKKLLNGVIGQDKVDRMVRLSKINMLLMGGATEHIYSGNSISKGTHLDSYLNKVDLIITNPPFGADYPSDTFNNDNRYTILLNEDFCNNNIPSELILLDRSLTLLKPGGKLVIVVPDSVVSSNVGIYKKFRKHLLETCNLKGVIELPSVTFGQAGTRTKTSIIYLEKNDPNKNNKVYMTTCEDIGFEVKSRKGVPVKVKTGTNQMEMIADSYISFKREHLDFEEKKYLIVNKTPSATFIEQHAIINNALNPNLYNYNRLNSILQIESLNKNGYETKKLSELVRFSTKERKSYNVDENVRHISVLHINNDGTIKFEEVDNFVPISKGRECFPGDIIFSKINPRIYRVAVVPEYSKKLVCSNEFEILTPIEKDSYYVYALLILESTKKQVLASTSGTSSSHNRIKPQDLMEIKIPVPIDGSKTNEELELIVGTIKDSIFQKYISSTNYINSIKYINDLITT